MAQDSGERVIVGVTDHREDISPYAVDGFMGVDDAFDVAIARLEDVRRTRGERRAGDALRELERVCRGSDNIMPAMMEALDADVTLGEVGDVWRGVFGDWNTPIQT